MLYNEAHEFYQRCKKCDHFHMGEHTDSQVWRHTAKEQLDNLEDHMKEIKKQLMFK